MSLDLVRRLVKGSPLNAVDYDQNLDKLENAIENSVQSNDIRLINAREWSAATIEQAESEGGVATTRRAFTAQRVRQAIEAWWAAVSTSAGRALVEAANAAAQRTALELGTAATQNVGTAAGNVVQLDGSAKLPAVDGSALTGLPPSGVTAVTGTAPIVSSGGSSPAISISAATTDAAGSMSSADKTKLNGIEAGAQVNVATDLSYTASTRLLSSSTGADVTLPEATTTVAGLLSGTDKTKLDGVAAGATATPLSNATPQAPGTAAAGSSTDASRADHVHALPPVVTSTTAGLQPASGYDAITYAATVTVDMSALDKQFKTISLTGALEFETSNRAAGREVRLRLVCDGTQRTLTFPAGWVFVSAKPATLPASKTAVLSIAAFGTNSSDIVAAIAIQP